MSVQNPFATRTNQWIVLLLVSFVIAANYYYYSILGPIKDVLQNNLKLDNSSFGLILSAYSFPNVFLAMTIFGGLMVDKWGLRFAGVLFVSLTAFGAVITSYAASSIYSSGGIGYNFMSSFLTNYSPEFKMMYLGRFLYGMGAETSIVIINAVIVKWFKGSLVAVALAVNVAIARVGSWAVLILSPTIRATGADGWSYSLWVGAAIVVVSVFVFIIYNFYDRRFDKSSLEKQGAVSEEFKIKDVINLITNPSYVFIILLCVTFYSAVFPVLDYIPDFFSNKFGFSPETSSRIASLLPLATIPFTIFFGWFVDKRGRTASIMIYGSLLLIFVHIAFAFTSIWPQLVVIVLGLAFSLVPAAMWPAVPKIVDANKIGTAYGFMTWVQNFGLWLFPWLIGVVLDESNANRVEGTPLNYTNAFLMLACLGISGLVFALLLKSADKKQQFGLELPLSNQNKQEKN